MIKFLKSLLEVDSTSGKEENIVSVIKNYLPVGVECEIQEISNGKKNIFFKWGKPEIIFCSHFDTVPPYIPPVFENDIIRGRGTCDAKGQIAAMYQACLELKQEGMTNFGLLMLAGEEVGSYGAKKANELIIDCEYVIVGEPTENKLITAGKGNILYEFEVKGKSSHSGYPENGDDAIEHFRNFLNSLSQIEFPNCSELGSTTYNIGNLSSSNAHNVVPYLVTFKIFFRTTFTSHNIIENEIKKIISKNISYNILYEDKPIRFHFVEGFETSVVAYGSDAPDLYNLGKRLLYGAGSILNAHTPDEFIYISELYRAAEDYKKLFYKLRKN